MKTLRHLLIVLLLVTLGSCTTSIKFPVSKTVPSAEGVAKISKDKNGNYQIQLTVKHLANPERLTPPRNQYIVWALSEDAKNQNIGRLSISKSMAGSLKTSTPFRPVQLFVTAETEGTINRPGTYELFRTENFNIK